jgi:nitrite reductase (NADH) small subunit
MSTATALKSKTGTDVNWQALCTRADLVEFSGVAAWLKTETGPAQVALFYIPGYETELFAVDNHDPLGKANVIARGIIGDVKGEPVVASPLYKQHYRLKDGRCVEDDSVKLRTWPVRFDGDQVMVKLSH